VQLDVLERPWPWATRAPDELPTGVGGWAPAGTASCLAACCIPWSSAPSSDSPCESLWGRVLPSRIKDRMLFSGELLQSSLHLTPLFQSCRLGMGLVTSSVQAKARRAPLSRTPGAIWTWRWLAAPGSRRPWSPGERGSAPRWRCSAPCR